MPRRRHVRGEGSLFQRSSDGRWVASVYLGTDAQGKAIIRQFSAKTAAEALAKRAKAAPSLSQPSAWGDDRQKLSAFLPAWLKTQAPHLASNTAQSYQDLIDRYIVPHVGKVSLGKLSPAHVAALFATLAGQGLSARTIRYTRSVLGAALNAAVEWGVLARNVVTQVEAPKLAGGEVKPGRALSVEEAKRVLAALAGHPLEALFAVGLALGVRQSEALGLRWADVDLGAGTVTITGAVHRDEAQKLWYRSDVKRRASRRTLVVPPFAVALLARRRVVQKEQQLRAGPRWVGNDWDLVFTTGVGTPLLRSNLLRVWVKTLETAQVPHARYYDMRHAAASLLRAQGLDLKEISAFLGHASVATTANIYTHLFADAAARPAAAMEHLFGSSGDSSTSGVG